MLIPLPKEKIDQAFEEAKEQHDYWYNLWKIAFPDLDELEEIEGYPEISEATSKYIYLKAIRFDKQHHPKVFAGGLWMQYGFAENPKMDKNWVIDTSTATVHRKEDSND